MRTGLRNTNINQSLVRSGRVTIEGDELYYEVRGQGQPLLLIPGGGGDGDSYAAIADILCDEYKVITYDRRANARSTMRAPQNFEISQQSRDAVAVLHAAGETSAFVCGSSSGAVIALDMAKTHPQAVRAAVAHEPAIPRVLPRGKKWERFFASVYWTGCHFGPPVAGIRFILGMPVPALRMINAQRRARKYITGRRARGAEQRLSGQAAAEVLVKLELLPATNYLPDVGLLKRNDAKVFMAVGEWALARKTWFAQAAQVLAEQLGGEVVTFPGHHVSYMDMPEEWAAALRRVLRKTET